MLSVQNRSLMLIVGMALAAPLAAPDVAQAADSKAGSFEVGGFVGYQLYSDDIELGNSQNPDKRPGSALLFGARVGYNLFERVAIEGELKYGLSDYRDSGESAHVLGWRGMGLLYFDTGDFRPFALLGYGGETLLQEEPGTETDTDAALHVGVGFKNATSRAMLWPGLTCAT